MNSQSRQDALIRQLQGAASALKGPYTNPTRAFATSYQPNVNRPTLVLVSVFVAANTGDGTINAFCGPATAPTTPVGRFRGRNNTVGVSLVVGGVIPFIVPAGYYYQLTTTTTAGTPVFSIEFAAELTI